MAARTKEREEFLAEVIITAIEGGTGYWATVFKYKHADLPPAEVHAIIAENDAVEDAENDTPPGETIEAAPFLAEHGKRIGIDTIARGLGQITRGEIELGAATRKAIVEAARENDAGEIDADDADVIVQAGLFNKIIYG